MSSGELGRRSRNRSAGPQLKRDPLALTPMRIFSGEDGDPMLLDTRQGLSALHEVFNQFLVSRAPTAAFEARTTGDPEPYREFLRGLRVSKGGPPELRLSPDKWLELSGSLEDLSSFCQQLLITEDGAHHHWYSSPVSLIIEADDDYGVSEG